jgi:uncharacterized membrane protein
MTITPTGNRVRGGASGADESDVNQVARWGALAGGGALVLFGLTRRSLRGLLLALAGGGLIYRGVAMPGGAARGGAGGRAGGGAGGIAGQGKRSPADARGLGDRGGGAGGIAGQGKRSPAGTPVTRGIHVERTVTVDRPVGEVYCCWRELENLPRFMKHLESVQATADGRSHWVARGPLGARLEWDAEIINDQENRLLAWRSLSDAATANAGLVRFEEQAGDAGPRTEVRVMLEYNPPAGAIGAAFAKLFGEDPAGQIDDDLQRFKVMMEGDELAAPDQPSARGRKIGDAFLEDHTKPLDRDDAESEAGEASEESFPASDPPAWTGGREPGNRS